MESSKLSFWKIFAIILLISNTVILAFVFFEKPARGENKGPANFIIKELKFEEAQIESFNKLKFAHQESLQALQITGRELREDYFKLLRNDTTDNILADQLLIQIANNQKTIEQVTFSHFQSVKNICDIARNAFSVISRINIQFNFAKIYTLFESKKINNFPPFIY